MKLIFVLIPPGLQMFARRRDAATTRTRTSRTRVSGAGTTATVAAQALLLVATSTLLADAFAIPPTALLSQSTGQHGATIARYLATFDSSPSAVAITTLSKAVAIDVSEWGGTKTSSRLLRFEIRHRRLTGSFALPLRSSRSSGNVPESSKREEDEPLLGINPPLGMPERDQIQETLKLDHMPAPFSKRTSGDLGQEDQEEELDRREARRIGEIADPYLDEDSADVKRSRANDTQRADRNGGDDGKLSGDLLRVQRPLLVNVTLETATPSTADFPSIELLTADLRKAILKSRRGRMVAKVMRIQSRDRNRNNGLSYTSRQEDGSAADTSETAIPPAHEKLTTTATRGSSVPEGPLTDIVQRTITKGQRMCEELFKMCFGFVNASPQPKGSTTRDTMASDTTAMASTEDKTTNLRSAASPTSEVVATTCTPSTEPSTLQTTEAVTDCTPLAQERDLTPDPTGFAPEVVGVTAAPFIEEAPTSDPPDTFDIGAITNGATPPAKENATAQVTPARPTARTSVTTALPLAEDKAAATPTVEHKAAAPNTSSASSSTQVSTMSKQSGIPIVKVHKVAATGSPGEKVPAPTPNIGASLDTHPPGTADEPPTQKNVAASKSADALLEQKFVDFNASASLVTEVISSSTLPSAENKDTISERADVPIAEATIALATEPDMTTPKPDAYQFIEATVGDAASPPKEDATITEPPTTAVTLLGEDCMGPNNAASSTANTIAASSPQADPTPGITATLQMASLTNSTVRARNGEVNGTAVGTFPRQSHPTAQASAPSAAHPAREEAAVSKVYNSPIIETITSSTAPTASPTAEAATTLPSSSAQQTVAVSSLFAPSTANSTAAAATPLEEQGVACTKSPTYPGSKVYTTASSSAEVKQAPSLSAAQAQMSMTASSTAQKANTTSQASTSAEASALASKQTSLENETLTRMVGSITKSTKISALQTGSFKEKRTIPLASGNREGEAVDLSATLSQQEEQKRETAGGSSVTKTVVAPALSSAREDQRVLSAAGFLDPEAMTAVLRIAVLKSRRTREIVRKMQETIDEQPTRAHGCNTSPRDSNAENAAAADAATPATEICGFVPTEV